MFETQSAVCGEIKIHTLSSVITLLVSYWWTSGNGRGFCSPLPKTKRKKKSLLPAKQRPRWLYESTFTVSLVIPLSMPCTSTIAIQVPNSTRVARCSSAHMTNWAYYQKSALAGGSGWGEGRVRGVRWGFQQSLGIHRQKRGTKFSRCWQAKRIHFNHKWLPLGSRKGHQELGHACICVCLLVQLTRRSCANFWYKKIKKKT